MEKINIRAFRAVDDRDACLEFSRQHAHVLEAIGVHNIVVPETDWYTDPDTIVFVAEHDELGMVGGFRLQRDKEGHPLPMHRALHKLDPRVDAVLARLRENGNYEMTALWNAHRFAGRGVPMLLMSSMIAAASQLPLGTLTIFVAEYMGQYAVRNGMVRMSIGNEGEFAYPIAGIRSLAMILEDPEVLSRARMEDRHRILSLRMRPEQVRIENPKSVPLEVTYKLLLSGSMALDPYRSVLGDRNVFAA